MLNLQSLKSLWLRLLYFLSSQIVVWHLFFSWLTRMLDSYLDYILFDVQALFDLENTNQELKSDLKDLYINSAV